MIATTNPVRAGNAAGLGNSSCLAADELTNNPILAPEQVRPRLVCGPIAVDVLQTIDAYAPQRIRGAS